MLSQNAPQYSNTSASCNNIANTKRSKQSVVKDLIA